MAEACVVLGASKAPDDISTSPSSGCGWRRFAYCLVQLAWVV